MIGWIILSGARVPTSANCLQFALFSYFSRKRYGVNIKTSDLNARMKDLRHNFVQYGLHSWRITFMSQLASARLQAGGDEA